MTNGDKIRAMTDDELAEVIMCPTDAGLSLLECPKRNCVDCCKDWLRQEAEDG